MLFKILRRLRLNTICRKLLSPLAGLAKNLSMSCEDALALLTAHSPDPKGSAYFPGRPMDTSPDVDLDIIVPVYGVEKYLRDCIASILQQETGYRFRAIFVDDGSPDACGRILDEYPPDPRMVIIHQKNMGLSGARNTGLAHAQGAYVLFLDSDDRLAPGAVDAMLSAAFSRRAAMVQGCFASFVGTGSPRRELSFPAPIVDNPPLNTLPGYAWGKLIRRDLFAHLQFPLGYWYEDSINAQLLFPLLLRNQETVVGIDQIVCYYRENPQGISHVAQRRPKALDSFWITKALYADRPFFSLENTQFDYELVLNMILLTFERTQYQPKNIQQALMVQWEAFLAEQFPGFHTHRAAFETLEDAIHRHNFTLYRLCCQLL